MPQYLKSMDTGKIFSFSEERAKLPNMQLIHEFDELKGLSNDSIENLSYLSKSVTEMTKRELIAFASHEFQVVLDGADPKADLLEQVTQLMQAREANG
ncbi:hypothetical protein [Pleionea sp. CnH1-48]|uniref:hypothetical protein n=1 Tax=Pleionea sp. CnH1-48 TaxID=2954494 RepID=UPI002096BDB2|nr:hypothetical protein [Pleionea sp. CnH1-48]MCO7225926.1 hypothetical protein [Pleionea sp. CnH1-48]